MDKNIRIQTDNLDFQFNTELKWVESISKISDFWWESIALLIDETLVRSSFNLFNTLESLIKTWEIEIKWWKSLREVLNLIPDEIYKNNTENLIKPILSILFNYFNWDESLVDDKSSYKLEINNI